jgi:hypothetical protein
LVDSVLLNLVYDDTNSTVSAYFSFDDGMTTWEPFAEYAIAIQGVDTNTAVMEFDEWELKASSFTPVPIPAALPLFSSAIGVFGLIGRKRRIPHRVGS